MKKPLYIVVGALFLASLALSSSWVQYPPKAELLSESFSEKFINALQENDTEFFTIISPEQSDAFVTEVITAYPKKMDLLVVEESPHLFFSFLGIRENSSILSPIYGTWNGKEKNLEYNTPLSVSIMEQSDNSITFTNTSKTPFPVDDNTLLLPKDIKGSITFSNKLLQPGDSFVFTSPQTIPPFIFQIESLTYGYTATVQ